MIMKKEDYYITDPEEYKIYAQLMREEEPICVAYDLGIREFVKEDAKGKNMVLNGGVSSDGFGMPMTYECSIGYGITNETGKREYLYNMYEINLYPGIWGLEIYKRLSKSLHCKCFEVGQNMARLWHDARDGKEVDSFHRKTAIYENLETEEILTYLVNKNIITFPNVNHDNKYNLKFLEEMQKRMIEVLLHFNIIYYNKNKQKYEETYMKQYEKPENVSYEIILLNRT